MKIAYPSTGKLLDRVDSRYSLSVLASERAHEFKAGNPATLDKSKSSKSVGQTLEEITAGKVIIDLDHKTDIGQLVRPPLLR